MPSYYQMQWSWQKGWNWVTNIETHIRHRKKCLKPPQELAVIYPVPLCNGGRALSSCKLGTQMQTHPLRWFFRDCRDLSLTFPFAGIWWRNMFRHIFSHNDAKFLFFTTRARKTGLPIVIVTHLWYCARYCFSHVIRNHLEIWTWQSEIWLSFLFQKSTFFSIVYNALKISY